MNPFASLMVKMGADVRGLQAGLLTASGQIKGFATKNSALLRTMGASFLAMGAAATIGLGMAVKEAAQFQSAILNAASVTGYLGEELDKAKISMEGLATTLGETTVFTASEAASAMYDLASKGFRPAEMSIAELQPLLDLAAATQADLTTATETVTSTVRAFGLQINETQRVADVFTKAIGSSAATINKLKDSMSYIAPIAKAANISLEETAAALGKIYDLGFPASMAGTALRRALAELMKPSAKLKEILGELNMKFSDVDTTAYGLVGVLRNLDRAGISNAQTMELFGTRAGPLMTALLGVDASGKAAYEGITDLTEALKNSGGEAERVAKVQLQSFNNQLKLLMSAFQSVQIEVGNKLLPVLTKLVQSLADGLRGIKSWMKEFPILSKYVVYLTGILGLLAIALGTVALVLGPLAPLMVGFSQALGLVALAALKVKTAMVSLALVFTLSKGVFLLFIGQAALVAAAIIAIVLAVKEVVIAWEALKKAQADATESMEKADKTFVELWQHLALTTLKIKGLTDAEKKHSETILEMVELYKKQNDENDKDRKVRDLITKSILKQLKLQQEVISAHKEEYKAIVEKQRLTVEFLNEQKKIQYDTNELVMSEIEFKRWAYAQDIENRKQALRDIEGLQEQEITNLEIQLDKLHELWLSKQEGTNDALKEWNDKMDSIGAGYLKMSEDANDVFGEMPRVIEDVARGMSDTLQGVFFDVFSGELKSASEYFNAFANSIRASFAKMLADMVAKAMWAKAVSGLASLFGWGGTASVASNAGSLPTGTIATTGMARAQGGIDSIPSEGAYYLHRGEQVVPKHEVGGNGQSITIISVFDKKMIPAIMAREGKGVIVNVINEDMARSGSTRKTFMTEGR